MTLRSAFKLVVEWAFRWIPVETEPRPGIFGNPNSSSPVLLTCNYDLTVRKGLEIPPSNRLLPSRRAIARHKRLMRVLRERPKGTFRHIGDKIHQDRREVDHRTLILPQLSVPEIDVDHEKKETGRASSSGQSTRRTFPPSSRRARRIRR